MEERAIHQVGPRYGIRNFVRQIEGEYEQGPEQDMEETYRTLNRAILELQRRKGPVTKMLEHVFKAIDAMKGDAWDAGLTQHKPKHLKQSHEIILHSIYNGKWFRASSVRNVIKEGMTNNEMMGPLMSIEEHVFVHIMNRFVVSPKRFDHQMYFSGIAFHRHALERFYEREHVGTGKMLESIRCWMPQYLDAMAFAISAGLMTDPFTSLKEATEESIQRALPFARPAMAIPCGSGLMLVQMSPTIHTVSQFNEIAAKREMRLKQPTFHPAIHKSFALNKNIANVLVAMTFVSGDMLRQEQEEYRKEFLALLSEVDIGSLRFNLFSMRDPHQTECTWPLFTDKRLDILRERVSGVVENRRKNEAGWDFLSL